MAFKGTAAKSASGASMSKYDVEVESRLSKLEAAVAALQAHEHDAPATGSDPRVEQIVATLKAKEPGKWRELH
jgi:hypothetical protein